MLGKKGFTLIELLAVMAILAVLADMVAPAVTGTQEASVTAKTLQDATQVRSASDSYFKDQRKAEIITPHSVTTSTLISGATSGDAATQKVSTRWPEQYITLQFSTTDSTVTAVGAVYSEEFNTTPDSRVKEVTLLDTKGVAIGGSDFLKKFTAIDLERLQSGKYLANLPDAARSFSNGNLDNFLWLFEKKSASRTTQDDDRAVSVLKLVKVEKLEGQTTAGGVQKVRLTYRQLFGGATGTPLTPTPTATLTPTPTPAPSISFFLSPGTGSNGDLAWQSAVGSFTEFDLNGFTNGQVVKNLSAGSTIITVGPATAGQMIFYSSFGGGGGVYGTVSGGTLVNNDGITYNDGMTFSFSQPVKGFGLWIFDDGMCCPNSFVMTVTEVGGASVTSGILDASPGSTAHTVEGFLGATSSVGITLVTVYLGIGGVFEVDHLQVGGPAP